nr:immunoglobulin heavy chain junction region [Macaca mulatta]
CVRGEGDGVDSW